MDSIDFFCRKENRFSGIVLRTWKMRDKAIPDLTQSQFSSFVIFCPWGLLDFFVSPTLTFASHKNKKRTKRAKDRNGKLKGR